MIFARTIAPPPHLRLRELAVAAAVVAVLVWAQIRAAGGRELLARPLWLDEIHTILIADDPDFAHSMRALGNGADTNPPALFLLLRGWMTVYPHDDGLRIFAAAWMALAIVGAYAGLRQACGPLAAAAGALVIWSSPLAIHHGLEARFYAPLLAATAWFCFAVQITQVRLTYARGALLAATSLLMCTLHYFGVLAWAAVIGVELLVHRGTLAQRIRQLLPSLAGPAGLAACLPFLLGQIRATGGGSWLPPVSGDLLAEYVRDLAPLGAPWWVWGGVLVAATATWWLGPRDPQPAARALAPQLACSAVAVAVLAISLTVQPALLARYAIAWLLAPAAATTLLLRRLRPLLLPLICAGLILNSSRLLAREAREQIGPGGARDQLVFLIDALQRTDASVPILFERRTQHYAVARAQSSLADRCFFIGLAARGPDAPPIAEYERRVARAVERFYPRYRVLDGDPAALGRCYVVTPAPLGDVQARFGQAVIPYAPMVYEVRPADR